MEQPARASVWIRERCLRYAYLQGFRIGGERRAATVPNLHLAPPADSPSILSLRSTTLLLCLEKGVPTLYIVETEKFNHIVLCTHTGTAQRCCKCHGSSAGSHWYGTVALGLLLLLLTSL